MRICPDVRGAAGRGCPSPARAGASELPRGITFAVLAFLIAATIRAVDEPEATPGTVAVLAAYSVKVPRTTSTDKDGRTATTGAC